MGMLFFSLQLLFRTHSGEGALRSSRPAHWVYIITAKHQHVPHVNDAGTARSVAAAPPMLRPLKEALALLRVVRRKRIESSVRRCATHSDVITGLAVHRGRVCGPRNQYHSLIVTVTSSGM